MKVRILVGLLAATFLWGQDAPGRVARLSYLYGSVSFRPDNVEEWAPATLNYPLSNGDHLWTDDEAQAEVIVGLTAAHIAPATGYFISALDDRVFRMGVAEGAINVRIPRLNEGETVEVETPFGSFRLLQTGAYRVDVQPDSQYASLIVRSGAAEAVADGQTFAITAGQRAALSGKPAAFETLQAPTPDPWDQWCAARDEAAERGFEASQQYVSWEISGAADLAAYGDWEADESYGYCWYPRGLPVGWAPYRFGHWVFRAPWGWTWVDDQPWGFAPTHWGHWLRLRDRWVWVPGPRNGHPRYLPAVVAFSGTRDSRFVAWVPLAPGERVDRRRPFRNREAMTAATQADFASSRSIGAARLIVIDRGATTFGERTALISPTRDSLLGGAARATGKPGQRRNPEPVATRPVELPTPKPVTVDRQIERRAEETRRQDEDRRAEDIRRQAEGQRRAEDLRRQEDQRRAEDLRRQADDQRSADEVRRQAENQRQADESRRQEERRRADDARRQAEDQRRAEESRRQEEQRRADDARRQAEDHRRAEESRRQADDQRRAEESRRQEEQRRADDARRQAEDHRRAEESRRQDEQRRADDSRRQAEDHRRAEESRRQDEQKRSDEQQRPGKK